MIGSPKTAVGQEKRCNVLLHITYLKSTPELLYSDYHPWRLEKDLCHRLRSILLKEACLVWSLISFSWIYDIRLSTFISEHGSEICSSRGHFHFPISSLLGDTGESLLCRAPCLRIFPPCGCVAGLYFVGFWQQALGRTVQGPGVGVGIMSAAVILAAFTFDYWLCSFTVLSYFIF